MNPKHLTLFCAGLGAGAALAVLFAPKSGEETREQLRASFQEGKRKINDTINDKQSAIREQARGVVDNVNSAINAGREAYRSTTGQLKKEFDHATSSVG